MKCLDLRIRHSDETLHPVHRFEIEHADFHGSELLHWNPSLGEQNTMIFRVRGDPDVYRDVLEDRDETLAYAIAPVGDGVFYCVVCEQLTDRDRAYIDAFVDGTAVVIPPVRYNQDGSIDVTIVGSSQAIEEVHSGLPEDAPIEVRSITDYQTRVPGTMGVLTDRQREAVTIAVECGYYNSPREGRVEEVAEALGVSTSTASEHLRKAEMKAMRQILEQE